MNKYDNKDQVRRNRVIIAGPIKVAEYQVRDPETQHWSSKQFHFTYDNTVLAVMEENSARLFADFVRKSLGEGKTDE